MRRLTPSWLGVFLALVIGCGGAHWRGETRDIFAQDGVRDLHLSVKSADLLRLRSRDKANTYYPADIAYLGIRARHVGIRSRGGGSRQATKLGLRVDMDRFQRRQRFAGHKALILDNLWQDAALVRERVAMRLYERMGLPAPREVFVRVFINGVYEGIYALVEEIDAQFLTRIGNDEGVLFEYKYAGPYHGHSLGTALAPYVALFDARTHEKQDADRVYGPLRDLLIASSSLEGQAWRDRVETLIDLRQLLTYVAVETFTSDNDGMLGYAGMNNFYLHRPVQGTRHQIVPWDKDQAFGDVEASIWLRADENVLVARALQFPDLRAHYLAALRRCAEIASADAWLLAQVEHETAVIDQSARQDRRKQYDEAARAQATEHLRAFAAARPSRVLAEVDAAAAIDTTE